MTNERVLRALGEERQLVNKEKREPLIYHTMIKVCLLKEDIEGQSFVTYNKTTNISTNVLKNYNFPFDKLFHENMFISFRKVFTDNYSLSHIISQLFFSLDR